jgi:hypothetical protein
MPFPRDLTESSLERDRLIRARAYELFEARGGEPGHHHADWLEAERQLLDEDAIELLEDESETMVVPR